VRDPDELRKLRFQAFDFAPEVDPVVAEERPPAEHPERGLGLFVAEVMDAGELERQGLGADRLPSINSQLLRGRLGSSGS